MAVGRRAVAPRAGARCVGLTLLVAFGGAITIAAVAGARRADSAFDRLLDESSASIEALGVLGLGGVVHSLLVASRRRRHDLAVATSLGFTRTQLASTVRWQGLLTASAAIVVGLPLGVLVGRLIWKQVADGVGALDLVSIPWATFVLVPAVALLIVGALGTVVGHRTARLDPARTLRGE